MSDQSTDVPRCGCGKEWPAVAIRMGAQCVDCGQNSPPPPPREVPRCPDCATELTPIRNRRGGHYQWCWKCERALRPGDRKAAEDGR